MDTMQDIADKLIALGHGFPHVTMNMKVLPPPVIFDTQNQEYIESIFFIGFLPLILLLLLMVALMVYYCVIRFSNEDKIPKKTCCSVNICCYTTSGVFIICLSVLGLAGALLLCKPAFDDMSKSITKLDPQNYEEQINSAPDAFARIQNQLRDHEDTIESELKNDQASYDEWMGYKEELKQFDQSMFPDYQGNSMARSTENLQLVELYRYWGSVGLFSFYVLLIILSFVAICCKSKCMMLGVTCALFFALAICHLTLYAQLSIGVGLADYCSDPLAAQESSLELPECESNLNLLGQFKDLVDGMHSKMSDLSTTVPRDEFSTLTSDLDSLKSTITEIEVVKNCDFIEEEASSITESLCGQYIVGWWSVLASSLLISIFIAQLLFFAPCVWRSFDYGEDSFDSYDETTPFVRGQTFARPVYPQRQSVTLSFLRHESNEQLVDVGGDQRQPPPYSSFR